MHAFIPHVFFESLLKWTTVLKDSMAYPKTFRNRNKQMKCTYTHTHTQVCPILITIMEKTKSYCQSTLRKEGKKPFLNVAGSWA